MIKRFYRDRQYIGVQDHAKDSWGNWQDITSIKLFLGKPDSFYNDEIYEYSASKWAELVNRIKKEAIEKNREFAETPVMATTYPIWIHTPKTGTEAETLELGVTTPSSELERWQATVARMRKT